MSKEDFSKTLQDIIYILQQISNAAGRCSAIEKDIALQKLREAYCAVLQMPITEEELQQQMNECMQSELISNPKVEAPAIESSLPETESTDEMGTEEESIDESRIEEESMDEMGTEEESTDELRIEEESIDESRIEEESIDELGTEEESIDELGTEEESIDELGTEEESMDETGIEEESIDETGTEEESIDELRIEKESIDEPEEMVNEAEDIEVESDTEESKPVQSIFSDLSEFAFEPEFEPEFDRKEDEPKHQSSLFDTDVNDILDFSSTSLPIHTQEEQDKEVQLEQETDSKVEMVASNKSEGSSPSSEKSVQIDLFSNTDNLPNQQKEVKRSLNDLLNQQREDHSIANKFQNAKVDDLSKAIALNDKFLYIKELFNNQGEAFASAIQKLNRCTSEEEAMRELEMYRKYYAWDVEKEAYHSLCELIRRKF